MSLNGLDSASVAEAYASALAEAGGWFLLKYASRDAVEILTRGTGGLVEARGAISQYEDKSPLYGFLLYRRRKVLIKYTPEGTSRLLQARVTVHFQAITEKFSPHDTILPITTAEELSDAALSAACSLHTAAPSSSSSSSSSRRRKLDEITEDAEEGQATADDTSSMTRPMTAASTIPTIVEPSSPDTRTEAKSEASEKSTLRGSVDRTPTTPQAKTTVPHVSVDAVLESASTPNTDLATADYVASLRNYESHFDSSYEARFSSQTARPSTSELYDYLYKPKVKLGPRPRPSIDVGKRPHTSGTGSKEDARPVSQLPPGLRIAQRKTDLKRPKSRDSSVVPSIAFPPPPPIPHIPELSLITPMRPGSSPASIRSLPARTSGMTPEKQRLMKALELRKKQMNSRKAKEANEADKARDAALAPAAVVAEVPPVEKEQTEKPPAVEPELAKVEPSLAIEESPEEQSVPNTHDSSSAVTEPPKADSAVEVLDDDHPESEDLQSASASSPTSAQTQGSSESPSTRPSSVSEEEDHTDHDQDTKPDLHVNSTSFGIDGQADAPSCQDAPVEESVESSPTVVPEDSSPVPSIEVIAPATSRSENGRETVELNSPSVAETVETVSAQPSPSPTPSELKRRSTVEVREKRRALVEPIRIDLTTADASDTEYLSDDSFMEELQSAKFEQAQPVSVSKSPISPFFPRKFSNQSIVSIPERSSSNQFLPGERRSPQFFGGDRTSSASWLTKPNQENLTVAKKINVSSGISQRIKALAEKSNRESTASVSPVTPPEASSSIVAQRKSSFRTPPASTGPSPVAQHTKRFSRQSFASFTSPSPDRQSILQPPETTNPMYAVQQVDKPESVQVTARIIRDPRTQKPNLTMPTQDSPLELHQSPLIIDHQKAQKVLIPVSSSRVSLARPEPASPELPASPQSTREASSSGLPRSSSESSWRSLGRRMSEAKPPPTAVSVRSQSAASLESFDEKKDDKKDSKRDSRTSRLFKRMSSSMSISSTSRKNLASLSPTVHEEDHEANLPSLREPPPAVQVGDLNIQFPDTLLWKRRWVEIDGSGNLVLTLSKANDHPRGITKRFHLTEFRTPYSPDQDAQELPNSVILDFLDGRTLQCACETYVSQVHVLQILREAHEAWMAYGQ
ncbi:uncharacterized protein BDZ99DRAFT_521493 [Mytilinidion resinicola]|uniref:ADF-H domain-containing protein n=1 Tax=Mytilinidion resinicola TaxID=574789 RepID=A0A6A6YM24_9PEZI|nr:uncharacterized protein BDZ99DRAFT_521493 [Mytilinidion resinicola]KAF2809025.1 hypothetical protein BDZ99DRAFT_521493 [Mytilinidion resinicola]